MFMNLGGDYAGIKLADEGLSISGKIRITILKIIILLSYFTNEDFLQEKPDIQATS